MHPRLARHVQTVRDLCAQPLSMAGKVERIVRSAKELVETPVPLRESLRRVPEEGYGRNLIWRDPDHGFVVIALIWPGGAGTPPHDHATWGVVAVSEGAIRVTSYRRDDDGSEKGRARLVELGAVTAGAGAVATTIPPHDDYHKIENPSDAETAVTIHTYGVNVKACRVFDVEAGTSEIRKLAYTNEPELDWTPA